jgi:regulator of replication initiation timing
MGKDKKAERIKELTETIGELLDQIRDLQSRLTREQDDNSALRSQVNQLQSDLASAKRKLDAVRRS